MNILIPTRNNPVALAGLLSSILAVTRTDLTALEGHKSRLVLVDGSNDPVISDPHLSRLLTRFDLTYLHFLNPQVNAQRIAGLRVLEPMENDAVLVVDDDHVLLTDPRPVVEEIARTPTATAFFGVCPDIINDKGFSDFALVTPDGGHHSLGRRWEGKEHTAVNCIDLKMYSANPGFLVTRAREALPILERFHARYQTTPAVADDAWARMLAEPPLLHTGLQALHVGNKNRWWNQWGIKHTAVRLAVEDTFNVTP